MPFVSAFEKYAGMLPVLEAAKAIVERDIAEALAWRSGLDGSTPGPAYVRVQFSQAHSAEYPLLIIEPATDDGEPLGAGGIVQDMTLDCRIYITKALNSGDLQEKHADLTREIIRYYDATRMALLSAPDSDWREFFPASNDTSKFKLFATSAVFALVEEGKAAEVAGQCLRSVGFELRVGFIEAQ